MRTIKIILSKAGIEVKNGKIKLSDVAKAVKVISATETDPAFMGQFIDALATKGYKVDGGPNMWRSPNVDDHTSTNCRDNGNGKLTVKIRFSSDGKKVLQDIEYDDPEDSDSWGFDYVIKDEREVKAIVSSVCGDIGTTVSDFGIFQNIATFVINAPDGLDIPRGRSKRDWR
jgi:hypothetical protein